MQFFIYCRIIKEYYREEKDDENETYITKEDQENEEIIITKVIKKKKDPPPKPLTPEQQKKYNIIAIGTFVLSLTFALLLSYVSYVFRDPLTNKKTSNIKDFFIKSSESISKKQRRLQDITNITISFNDNTDIVEVTGLNESKYSKLTDSEKVKLVTTMIASQVNKHNFDSYFSTFNLNIQSSGFTKQKEIDIDKLTIKIDNTRYNCKSELKESIAIVVDTPKIDIKINGNTLKFDFYISSKKSSLSLVEEDKIITFAALQNIQGLSIDCAGKIRSYSGGSYQSNKSIDAILLDYFTSYPVKIISK